MAWTAATPPWARKYAWRSFVHGGLREVRTILRLIWASSRRWPPCVPYASSSPQTRLLGWGHSRRVHGTLTSPPRIDPRQWPTSSVPVDLVTILVTNPSELAITCGQPTTPRAASTCSDRIPRDHPT